MFELIGFLGAIVVYLMGWNASRIFGERHYQKGYKTGYANGRKRGEDVGYDKARGELWEDVMSNGVRVGYGRNGRYWVGVPLEWLENSAHGQDLDPPTPSGRIVPRE